MKMHNRIAKATVAMLMMMLTIGLTSPAVLANGGDDSAVGSATGTNVAPEVTVADAPLSVSPLVECDFTGTVRDNNTLVDIENVVLILYTADATVDGEDNIANHYTFKYTAPDTWVEIGPDTGGSHIGTCTRPEVLTVQSGDYVFKITLSVAAAVGDWTARWTATDDNNEFGYKEDTFTVTEIITLSIDTLALTFTGAPGDENLPSNPVKTICTVNTNNTFKIQVKLSADWTGAEHLGTIGAENTYADNEGTNVPPYLVTLNTETYGIVWDSVAPGENVKKDIYWFLDLPVPLRDDVYTTTFHVQAATI